MDDSSLLARPTWPADSAPRDDTLDAYEEEGIVCVGFVNKGRLADVVCGMLGALLLVYSASCAADPVADGWAEDCLPGYWYVAIVVASAVLYLRPIHKAAQEPAPVPGARPLMCTAGRALDVAVGVIGTVGLGYGSSCGVALSVASRQEQRGLEAICLPAAFWTIPLIVAVMLIARPLWSIASRVCPLGSLYRNCHKWKCCCGCAWVYPLLCGCAFACLTVGHFDINTTIFGITNGIREINGTDSTFWGGIRDNAENGQWFVLFMAVFFNVVVLYVCLVLMVFSWFSPWRRGAMVTTVCLSAKWCAFHQYSNVVNAISLAFELIYPIIAPNGIWLEAVAGNGVVYQTLGLLITVSLVEVLLYTYAHSPRGAESQYDGDNDADFDAKMNPWSNSGGSARAGRLARRGSAAQIGYSMSSKQGESGRALFRRIADRKEKERTAAGWEQMTSGGSSCSCDTSGKICEYATLIMIPLFIAGFFVCFWVATLSEGTLEFDFVTDVPCQLGVLCPSILPAPVNCVETILRNSGRVVGISAGDDFVACGDFRTSLRGLYTGIWDSQIGYQHAATTCTIDEDGTDDCPEPGPACYVGECRPGPIILGINRVFGFLLTLGPIIVNPHIMMVIAAVIWFVPMEVRTMAHCILAMHMALAWSTLDVWTVTLAVRMSDLERFSTKAQQQTCAEFGEVLDPVPTTCFGAIGVLGIGYYWLIPACVFQWVVAAYVSFEGAGVILENAGQESSFVPEEVKTDDDVDNPQYQAREVLGGSDPLPLGADPTWREDNGSNMKRGGR